MFRRRRLFQPNPLSPAQLATLVQANQLMTDGKPLTAAPLFASVADAMRESSRPRRAANLYARAANAYADGNHGPVAHAYARAALTLFLQTKMLIRAATFYTNITRKMTDKGMNSAVGELQKEFASRITALPTKPISIPPPRRGFLPTDCPKCGAPVHSMDAIWVDENTIECEYCGAYIRSD